LQLLVQGLHQVAVLGPARDVVLLIAVGLEVEELIRVPGADDELVLPAHQRQLWAQRSLGEVFDDHVPVLRAGLPGRFAASRLQQGDALPARAGVRDTGTLHPAGTLRTAGSFAVGIFRTDLPHL